MYKVKIDEHELNLRNGGSINLGVLQLNLLKRKSTEK
jgi:hypothetical protein